MGMVRGGLALLGLWYVADVFGIAAAVYAKLQPAVQSWEGSQYAAEFLDRARDRSQAARVAAGRTDATGPDQIAPEMERHFGAIGDFFLWNRRTPQGAIALGDGRTITCQPGTITQPPRFISNNEYSAHQQRKGQDERSRIDVGPVRFQMANSPLQNRHYCRTTDGGWVFLASWNPGWGLYIAPTGQQTSFYFED